MAKNTGRGHRVGALKARSQTVGSSGHAIKRDTKSGKFMDVKKDLKPFKNVRQEK